MQRPKFLAARHRRLIIKAALRGGRILAPRPVRNGTITLLRERLLCQALEMESEADCLWQKIQVRLAFAPLLHGRDNVSAYYDTTMSALQSAHALRNYDVERFLRLRQQSDRGYADPDKPAITMASLLEMVKADTALMERVRTEVEQIKTELEQ